MTSSSPGELNSGDPPLPPGYLQEALRRALDDLAAHRIPGRIRERDHTVWRPDPREISNRLGWLDAGDFLRPQLPDLASFVDAIRSEGYRDVVLLGMGGSCLGPEVLRRSFGPVSGFPQLTVLDSTVPEQVLSVAAAIDPSRTLFIVSSKSGGTIETLSYYRFFRDRVEAGATGGNAGRNFVAITDSGTPLERLGSEAGFRRVFLNPEDIGGRYSVLSWFGMLPAALAGIEVSRLLDSAASMRDQCLADDPGDNPGLQLGALLGAMTLQGRDKVTLVTPPPIDSFGLWVEQMIAESLGKEGRGIVPVAGEPLLAPDAYGDDRLFVYLRPAGIDDGHAAIDQVASAGHPVMRLDLADCSDLGGEFFRWEYATAVAGSMLDVHPFDQPDVQGAKDNTDGLLETFHRDGKLPDRAPSGSLAALLERARPGDYLAITPYIPMDDETDALLCEIRARVMRKYGIATTSGYGPRFLHSTGQLHKGGPGSGLYLQLTMGKHAELPIPGQDYGFDVLATAQAIGDHQALSNLGRRLVTVDLGHDIKAGLRRLINQV